MRNRNRVQKQCILFVSFSIVPKRKRVFVSKKKKENEFCLLLPYFISFSTDGKNRLKKLGSAAYGSEAQNKNVHESHGPQKLKSQFMSQHVTYTVGHIFPTMMDNISIINDSWTSMIHYTSRGSNINIRIE